jgi:hypothetical protein
VIEHLSLTAHLESHRVQRQNKTGLGSFRTTFEQRSFHHGTGLKPGESGRFKFPTKRSKRPADFALQSAGHDIHF